MVPRKNKSHLPKDMEDLLRITYDKDRIEDRRKYEGGFVQEVISDQFEKSLPTLLGRALEKVPETHGVKTSDCISADHRLVVKATSINSSFQPDNVYHSENFRIVDKINSAIAHAEEKSTTWTRRTTWP